MNIGARILTCALLGGGLLVLSPDEARAQCSPPYLVVQQFPTAGQAETQWRICWQPVAGNGLVITAAHFKKSPAAPAVRLFWDARVAEIFVPYHLGSPRYLDVGYGFWMLDLDNDDCPSANGGIVLQLIVCKEVRDRGLAWKDDFGGRRGEEVVLWSVVDAGNYNYVVEWTFRDDGVVLGRVGSTGQNLPSQPFVAHMHGAIWRLDIDLDGFPGDAAHLTRHVEAGLNATDAMTSIATESGHQWNPLEFTAVHVQDATLQNANGHPSAYHLMGLRHGTPRHQESFTQNDFWVTRYHPAEFAAASLPSYVASPQNVANADIVVWYYGATHHVPRDEDGRIMNGTWIGEAHLMWTGFVLMPHNLFDKTPLCPMCP